MTRPSCLLSIAGTDPSGGAGIQVDTQVFRDWGFHGLSVITAVVSQNTAGVRRFEAVDADLLADQLDCILDDITPAGIKIGMVAAAASVDQIGRALDRLQHRRDGPPIPVVFDPVRASSASQPLVGPDVGQALCRRLIPKADLLTPNLDEAGWLLDEASLSVDEPGSLVDETQWAGTDLDAAARRLVELGCPAVLLKTGHLAAEQQPAPDPQPAPDQQPALDQHTVADVLAGRDGVVRLAALDRVDADVRGTGCQLSSAILAGLARGRSVPEAVDAGRRYVNALLQTRRRPIGRGRPVISRAAPYAPPIETVPDES